MIYKGLLIGFVGASTIGPIGFLIVQRVITKGKINGFASGIGVALADAIYGLIGGLGLTLITDVMVGNQQFLRLVGGGVLIWLGIKGVLTKQEIDYLPIENSEKPSLISAAVTMLLLTLSNPITILYFAAVYTGMIANGGTSSITSALYFGLGAFIGSLTWWIILVLISDWLKRKLTAKNISVLNTISGFLISFFGAWIIFSAF